MSVKETIREEWRPYLDSMEPYDASQVATVIAQQLRKNREFCAAYLHETLHGFVLEVGSKMVRDQRSVIRDGFNASNKTVREALRGRVQAEATTERWTRWVEFDPVSKQHMPLVEMTRAQVLAAAEVRRRRGFDELVDAAWLSAIGKRMNETQRVGEVWEHGDLDALREQVRTKTEKANAPKAPKQLPVALTTEAAD